MQKQPAKNFAYFSCLCKQQCTLCKTLCQFPRYKEAMLTACSSRATLLWISEQTFGFFSVENHSVFPVFPHFFVQGWRNIRIVWRDFRRCWEKITEVSLPTGHEQVTTNDGHERCPAVSPTSKMLRKSDRLLITTIRMTNMRWIMEASKASWDVWQCDGIWQAPKNVTCQIGRQPKWQPASLPNQRFGDFYLPLAGKTGSKKKHWDLFKVFTLTLEATVKPSISLRLAISLTFN